MTEGCVVSIHALFNLSDFMETQLNSGQVSLTRPLAFNGDSVWKQHQYHTWNRRSSCQNSLRVNVTHIFLAVSHGNPEYSTHPHICWSVPATQWSPAYKFYKFMLCLIDVWYPLQTLCYQTMCSFNEESWRQSWSEGWGQVSCCDFTNGSNNSAEYPAFLDFLEGVLDCATNRDFNAHVGNDSDTWRSMIGRNGLPDPNLSGSDQHRPANNSKLLYITNTMFEHQGVHRYTWRQHALGQR